MAKLISSEVSGTLHVSGASILSGNALIYGTASLSHNPTAAYILYNPMPVDKITIFPGLEISGGLNVEGDLNVSGTTSGTIAQFINITSSDVLLYGTASLSSNPSAAYIIYNSNIDKIVIFPGLEISGGLNVSGTISGTVASFTDVDVNILNASTVSASTVDATTISASVVSASQYVNLPISEPGGPDKAVQYNNNGTLTGSGNFIWDEVNKRLGIGTDNPTTQLEVVGAEGIKFKTDSTSAGFSIFDRPTTPGTQLVFQGNTGNYTLFNVSTKDANVGTEKESGIALWPVDIQNSINATQFQIKNSPTYDGVIFTQKYGTATSKKISLQAEWDTASAPTQLVLNTDGRVGIGTTSPSDKFHIRKGASGATAVTPSPLIVESDGYAYISTLAPNDLYCALIFGFPADNLRGGIFYAGPTSSTPDRLSIRTRANTIVINNDKVGIGTSTPSEYFSIGSGSPLRVNSDGNIVRINDVSCSFPSTQGSASTFLSNDGSGNLSWKKPSSFSSLTTVSAGSSNFTFDSDNDIFLVTSTAAVTGTLPSAATIGSGKIINIKRTGNFAIAIDPFSSQTIDGSSSSYVLNTSFQSVTLVSDGSNWFIL
jgi:hypothetical protein